MQNSSFKVDLQGAGVYAANSDFSVQFEDRAYIVVIQIAGGFVL